MTPARPISVRRVLSEWPVTVAVIAAAVAVHLAVTLYPTWNPEDGSEARRRFGASTELAIYRTNPEDGRRKAIPQLTGPFDLWGGELWRVTASGFHHADLMHLAMNCLGIAFMGWLLEPRMGSPGYAAFLLTAVTVAGVASCLLSNYGIGLSGGAYALFGCLVWLRSREPAVADRFPPALVTIGFVWLFLGMGLTLLELMPIDNVAHVTGLIYGWIVGRVFFGPNPAPFAGRMAFFAAHLLLVPAFYFIMHPFWIGRYHWYLAYSEENRQQQAAHYGEAIARDPSLELPWSELARHYADGGDRLRGWETILHGLDYNRSDDGGVNTARHIWNNLETPDERWQALQTLQAVFDDEARDWKYRLGILPAGLVSAGVPVAMEFGLPVPDADELEDDAEREFVELILQDASGLHDLSAPAVVPDASGSAAEGVTL